MPRKAETMDTRMIGQFLPSDEQALHTANTEETKRLKEIDDRFGINTPYDRTRVENEVTFYLNQSAEAMLQAGRRLVLLKEHESHGEFTKCLDRLGINPRGARRIMQAAVKYSDGAREGLPAALGKTKLFEFLAEDDEELDALAEGGTLAGHTLDEFQKMSTRELREALKDARADIANLKDEHLDELNATREVSARKDQKINELEERLARYRNKSIPPAEIISETKSEATLIVGNAMGYFKQMTDLVNAIANDDFKRDLDSTVVTEIVQGIFDQLNSMTLMANDLATLFEQQLGVLMPDVQHLD